MNRSTFTDIEPTKAIVYVANKRFEFFSLRLEQAYGEHHSFVIKADFDALVQTFMSNPTEHFELIGQTVDVNIQQGDDYANSYVFRGIIEDSCVQGEEGKHGYLVLIGSSPTILMEKDKRYDIFTNLTLKQVVRQLTEDIINYQTALPVINNPSYTEQTDFLMQYNESDWQFLRRLSLITKENMYWTGRDLVFGMHKDFPILEVSFGREVTSIEFSSRYLPNHITRYQYQSGKDSTLTKDVQVKAKEDNSHVNFDHEEAEIITEKSQNRKRQDMNTSDRGFLNNMSKQETIYVEGTCKTAHPRIGHLLKIKTNSAMHGEGEYGTYRITKVIHEFKQKDHYECQFQGISADLKYYPFLDVEIPLAKSIFGTVISNTDPRGQGRIRVEFSFSDDRVSDAWLQVMIPYAVFEDDKEENKSLTFIPKVGDQVIVNFTFGDSNRPYVVGSMFKNDCGEKNMSIPQEDYETILKFRDKIYGILDLIGQAVEKIKKEQDEVHQIIFLRMILDVLLLVAQTEKGRKMFLCVLEYAKHIDPELSNEYWKIYDEEVEKIIENGYYKVKKDNQ